MVQESIFLMSVFDLAVIGVVIFAFGYIYCQINIIRKSGTYFGFYLTLIGLSAVGLFHLIRLSGVIALPAVFPEFDLMSLMTDLRLEFSWFVVLVGTSLIVAGLVLASRGVLALVGSLEAAAREEVRAGQYLMLAVRDTGAGTASEVMECAIEPFSTTKESLVRRLNAILGGEDD